MSKENYVRPKGYYYEGPRKERNPAHKNLPPELVEKFNHWVKMAQITRGKK